MASQSHYFYAKPPLIAHMQMLRQRFQFRQRLLFWDGDWLETIFGTSVIYSIWLIE
jgi:hypothetical protein